MAYKDKIYYLCKETDKLVEEELKKYKERGNMDVEEIQFMYNQIKGKIKLEVDEELQERFEEIKLFNIIFNRFSWISREVHVEIMIGEDQLREAKDKLPLVQEILSKLRFKLVLDELNDENE